MAAMDYLQQAGLTVELNGDKLRLRPVDRITDADRLYMSEHRIVLIAELHAINTPLDHWLPRVAQLLGVLPAELLEGGYLDPHDLIEQANASAEQVAEQIRRGPTWITRTDTHATRTH